MVMENNTQEAMSQYKNSIKKRERKAKKNTVLSRWQGNIKRIGS